MHLNRHNFPLDEVRTAFRQEVVQRLLRLMEFRNSYPAFDGDFAILDGPDSEIILSWRLPPYETTAFVDLRNYRTRIEFFDPDSFSVETFRV